MHATCFYINICCCILSLIKLSSVWRAKPIEIDAKAFVCVFTLHQSVQSHRITEYSTTVPGIPIITLFMPL